MTTYGFIGISFQDGDDNVIQVARYHDDGESLGDIIEAIKQEASEFGLKPFVPSSGESSTTRNSGSNKMYVERLIGCFARDDKENSAELQSAPHNLPEVSPVLHCYSVPAEFNGGRYGKYADFSIYIDNEDIQKQVDDMLAEFDVAFEDLPFAGHAPVRDIDTGKTSKREWTPPLPVKAKLIKIRVPRKKDGEIVLDNDGNPTMKDVFIWDDRYSDMKSEFIGVADKWPHNSIKSMIPADAPIADAPDDFAPPKGGDNDEPFK